jgi:hypothetical protein
VTDPVSRPSPRPVEVAFDRLFEDGDEKAEMEDGKDQKTEMGTPAPLWPWPPSPASSPTSRPL